MSPISSIQPSLAGLSQAAAAESTVAVAETEATQRYTPLWLVNTGGSGSAALAALGIRMPSANGDLAVLLAQVSLSLEKSVDESNNSKTLSSFAALAGALSRFGLDAMGKSVDNKTAIVSETTATRKDLADKTTALLTESDRQAGLIANADTRIEQLETALKNDKLKPEERAALEDQLRTARTDRSAAFSARETADLALAQNRIDSLTLEVAQLDLQSKREVEGSPEAKAISDLHAAKSEELTQAQRSLDTFKTSGKSDAERTNFSSTAKTGVRSDLQDLDTRIASTQTALVGAVDALRVALSASITVAALAKAGFQSSQTKQVDSDSARTQSFEENFEATVENMDAEQGLPLEENKRLDERQDIAVQDLSTRATLSKNEAAGRAQATALALLSAVADIVQTLNAQSTSPQAPMAVPREMVASRLRVNV